MKSKLALAGAAGALLLSASIVFAGAKNATYIEWTWPAGIDKSAYFQTTGSGLVNAWTYDHPDFPEQHVEIGGFVQFAKSNPPESILSDLATKHVDFPSKKADFLLDVRVLLGYSSQEKKWRMTTPSRPARRTGT